MAWREFKKGKGSKQDVQEFEFNLEENIFQLHEDLKNKTYQHGSYSAFYVKDPKLRHIHKACVRDRVLHHAIFRILYPIFDRNFIYDSYSCRVGKGTHRGVDRLEIFIHRVSKNNSVNAYALKCDIKKFFDSIDQDILLKILKRKITDPDLIWLVEKIVHSFHKSEKGGLPLGNVVSQLFANVYLNELDHYIKHVLKCRYYVRYCDDFIILGTNVSRLIEIAKAIQEFLVNNLGLSLHPNKILIRKLRNGIDFLGYVLIPYHKILRTKTKRRVFRKIDPTNQRSVQSYLGILCHCDGFKIKQKILKLLG